ncbi:MAG: monovalent cation/H(+) antiporter subunit G [Kosmotogaceae bacterium]
MTITAYVLFFAGAFLLVLGTIRAVISKTVIITLHYLSVADTIGLSLLILSAAFMGLLGVIETTVILVVLVIMSPAITHIIARASLKSGRK